MSDTQTGADTRRLEAVYWFVMENEDALDVLAEANIRMSSEHYIDAARRFIDERIMPRFTAKEAEMAARAQAPE